VAKKNKTFPVAAVEILMNEETGRVIQKSRSPV
jgi:hypothetical protein